MAEFPIDEASRDRIRAEIMDYYVLQAVRRATDHMRSMRCQRGDHRCRNTGSTCLCLCHDVKNQATMGAVRRDEEVAS